MSRLTKGYPSRKQMIKDLYHCKREKQEMLDKISKKINFKYNFKVELLKFKDKKRRYQFKILSLKKDTSEPCVIYSSVTFVYDDILESTKVSLIMMAFIAGMAEGVLL